jgi:2-polyprenyl-3-methyl-5-hydroxy-6-metoxy-1,4-benzoquinol methylase
MIHTAHSAELRYQKDRAARIRQLTRTPDHVIDRYRACRHGRLFTKEFVFRALGDLREKRILDFGCGEGQLATQMARLGAIVWGIDISPELIELAQRRAELDGVEERAQFFACDILESPPEAASFDAVVCTDSLHHVDLYAVAPVLARCLKPGGTFIAKEPVSLSPWFQAIRDRLPIARMASPGDRQLNGYDLRYLSSLFPKAEMTWFHLFGRLARFLPHANRIDRGHAATRMAMLGILGLDRILAQVPALRRFYGEVVIRGAAAGSLNLAATP